MIAFFRHACFEKEIAALRNECQQLREKVIFQQATGFLNRPLDDAPG